MKRRPPMQMTAAAILALFTSVLPATAQTWNTLDTTPTPITGSALNLSFLNDPPAGKYGFIQIDTNGGLYFAERPGQTVRFYGGDLDFRLSMPLPRAQAQAVAARMAAMGCNVARLIDFDWQESWGQGPFNTPTSTNAGSLTLNAAAMEAFDYMVYSLKQQGIYIQVEWCYDMNVRSCPPLSSYYLTGDDTHRLSPLLPFVPGAYGLWQQAAQLFLTHVNPYTGLALKDDPIMVGISPWNEQLATALSNPSVTFSNLLFAEANAFCASNGLTPLSSFPMTSLSGDSSATGSTLMQFYTRQTLAAYANMKNFLKNTIGVKCPVTGLNSGEGQLVDYWRSQGPDVFEQHDYYQLLVNAWQDNHTGGPYIYNPASDYSDSDVFNWGANEFEISTSYPAQSLQQTWGQPFYMTEFNDQYPIPGHEECGIFAGAVGAFQGWDMLNRFGYIGLTDDDGAKNFKVGAEDVFFMESEPLALMSDYQGALLFRNGAVSNAPPRFILVWDIGYCTTNFNAVFFNPGLNNLFYLSYLYKTQNVYAPEPGNTFSLIYRDLTYAQITNGIATGNFPAANQVNITPSMSLQQAAQACIAALTNSGDADEIAVGSMQQANFNQNKLISETGQLVFDLTGQALSVNTPTAIAAAGTMNGVNYTFSQAQASLSSSETKEGTVSAFSLDGQPLTNSSRILVINTTDARGFGATNITDPGSGNVTNSTPNANATPTPTTPNQVLYATGNFTFTTTLNPSNFTAYRLTMNGNRLAHLPIIANGNQLSVNFDTSNGFAFEIIASTNPAPAVPAGLSIAGAPAAGQIGLAWNLALGATSYNVKRATVSGGPYVPVASGITSNSYTDAGLVTGQTCYYTVSDVNVDGIESSNSSQIGVTVTTPAVLDNAAATGVTTTGAWTTSTAVAGYYGANYLQDSDALGGKSVTFTPTIATTGYDDVYVRWPLSSGWSILVPVDVQSAQGTANLVINQTVNGDGWYWLGRYQFNAGAGTNESVTIRDDGATASVVADAVEFVPLAQPAMTIGLQGDQAVISWTGGGVLQSANEAQGPYTPVTNASNPYIVTPEGTMFLRVAQ